MDQCERADAVSAPQPDGVREVPVESARDAAAALRAARVRVIVTDASGMIWGVI